KVDINKDYIEKIGNVDNDIKLVTTKGLIYNSTGVYSDGSIYLRSTYDYENLERFGFDYYLHIHSKDNND
ncbi:MAG: hypothetical protein K6G26_09695, partial [Lachnospiraceae bacterium]|nr:hypothetical protein [Lachnospiraceae bacterium]